MTKDAQSAIKEWLPNHRFHLLYKASLYVHSFNRHLVSIIPRNHHHFLYYLSLLLFLFNTSHRDGFHAVGFHHFCDDKGPTLTLIRVRDQDKEYPISLFCFLCLLFYYYFFLVFFFDHPLIYLWRLLTNFVAKHPLRNLQSRPRLLHLHHFKSP